MYEKFYGLREKPFNVTPDPRFLYLSHDHREALAHLRYGVQERKGFVAITGEVGTGKTTLVHALLSSLDSSTNTAFIFSTSLTAKGLLRMLVADFGIATKAGTKTELLLDLNAFLLRQFSAGANAVLIVDEAQNLSFRLLEEIRMLSNLETDREKLLQIILVGQPELDKKLAMPELRQLRQRIGSWYHIHPLSPQDVAQYIQHRLRAGGLFNVTIFDQAAQERIACWSGGIPRLINMICDRAMLLGYTYEKIKIGIDIVDEAIADLQALGAVSAIPSAESEPVIPMGDVGQEREERYSWWRRVLRPMAAVSGLLLGATLLSMPPLGGGHRQVYSGSLNSHDLSAHWSYPLEGQEKKKIIPSMEMNPGYLEGLARTTVETSGEAFFSLHVASFQELARAEELQRNLREKGVEPVFIVPVQLPTLGHWQRVMVGLYHDADAAHRAAKNYLASGTFRWAEPRSVDKTAAEGLENFNSSDENRGRFLLSGSS